MASFFDTQETVGSGAGFAALSAAHWIELALFALITLAMCLVYRAGSQKTRRNVRMAFVALLIADELFKHAMLLYVGGWLPKYLPLHLCSINIFLVAWHAFRPSDTLGNYLYAIGLPAAVAALLFPTWANLPVWNFMHLHSLSVHILLAAYPIMLLSAGEIQPNVRFLPKALLILVVAAIPIWLINLALGTNFMFLTYAPKGNPLLWFETKFGNHLIGYPVLIAAVLVVMYAPIQLRYALRRRKGS